MSQPVIKVENISKHYRLGKIGTGTLAHDLNRWWHIVRGKEDPYLKIGEENDRTKKGSSEYVWALQNISFEVNRGDVVGIVGRNGAGKSTLLKLLSRTTLPTTGDIRVKGRIASLLEVGTGFHPELTGRENIYLNGAILGMTKREIRGKFDEIVDFAGVEKYVDTPVKRYSSGMYVRLAFAVAAHLEPEILIVDEVLAVGDAEFQKKALGKMKSVSGDDGRTILFVSHNIPAINSLCKSGILLSNGVLKMSGTVSDILAAYQHSFSDGGSRSALQSVFSRTDTSMADISILSADLSDVDGNNKAYFDFTENIEIRITYNVRTALLGSIINFIVSNHIQELYMSFDTDLDKDRFEKRKIGIYEAKVCIPSRRLKPGFYSLSIGTGIASKGAIEQLDNCLSFEIGVADKDYLFSSFHENRRGAVPMVIKWETSRLN